MNKKEFYFIVTIFHLFLFVKFFNLRLKADDLVDLFFFGFALTT